MLRTGEQLGQRGNWVSAYAYFEQAEGLFASAGNETQRLRAQLDLLRASLEHISLQAASDQVDQILTNRTVLNNPELHIRALAVRAETSFHSDLNLCYRTLVKIRELAIQLNDPAWANRATGDLGGIELHQGHYFAGIAHFQTALAKAALYNDVGAQMRYRSFMGEALVAAHQCSTATLFFESAIRLASQLPGAEPPFSSKIGIARCLLYSGREAAGMAQLATLLVEARARDLQFRQINVLMAQLEYYDAHNILTSQSAEVARQSYALASAHGLRRVILYSTTFLTKYYLAIHDLGSAQHYAKATILGLRAGLDVYNLPGILWALAGLQLAENKLNLADETYRESLNAVDTLLTEIPAPRDRNSIIAATTPIYDEYIAFLIAKLHEPERAFSLMEGTRARSVGDFLDPSRQSHEVDLDPRFDNRIRALTRQVYLAKRSELTNDLWDTENRATHFTSFRSNVPRTRSLSVKSVQEQLKRREMLIIYFGSNPNSFAISITSTTFNVTRLTAAKTLGRKIATLLWNILLLRAAPDLERELYLDLIAPIPSIADHRDLVIVTDATLNRLPFEMLRDQLGHYLIEGYAVSYAPSATAVALLRARAEPTAPAFLGVGGVNYGRASTLAPLLDVGLGQFGDLPSATSEIFAAKNNLNAPFNTLLLGAEATEEQFRSLRLETYRVIHFAVHGITDDHFPEHNALVLGDASSSREDGLLQVREIEQLHFRAQLVTLASCVSAIGTAEGLASYGSLAQAFLHAGAHSVLATDWHVDDRMTAKLMAYFYGHLSEGMAVSKALQCAKLDVIKRYGGDAPYYWAGFRIIGNGAERVRD